ncbi:alpha-tocopherol transfer protein-like isoform X2 [Halyomorpha halys]|uniref:alpha-tocopherol transfer protein-like isoform X2 n=1 Tax=Halyomorpha halys TaxID=286706 RepID=UPI0034D36880
MFVQEDGDSDSSQELMSAKTRTKKEIDEDLKRLREWLSKQPHLPKNIDDEILTAYVNGTKSLEIAKQKLDAYYSSKSKVPHLFSFPARDMDDDGFKQGCEALKVFFLPKKTPENYIVLFVTFDLDFSKFDHDQYLVRLMMMVDLAMLRWPDAEGIVLATDLSGMDASIFTKCNVTTSGFFFNWFQKTIAMKLKKAVAVNAPKFFETVMNSFVRPFLSQKLYGRIIVTSEGVSALKKFIPEQLLPVDLGGNEKSSTDLNKYWLEELHKRKEWFVKTNQQLVDETRRPADKLSTYGVDGTFRSLTIQFLFRCLPELILKC